jgi:predicted HicB family RNase H-like nuclease
MGKDTNMIVRTTESEKEAFNASAELAGMSLSAWIRLKLRAAAISEHKKVGKTVDF